MRNLYGNDSELTMASNIHLNNSSFRQIMKIHKRLSGVTFWYAPISSTHEGHVQMEYLFVYVPRLSDTSFSICCATGGAYRNGASVYICTCGVVEYRARENVTPALFILGNINLFLKLTRTFRSIKGLSHRSYSFISMHRMNPSVASFSSSAPSPPRRHVTESIAMETIQSATGDF